MEMKPSEILQSYQNAQYKTKQIGILAELNACSKEDIEEILKQMGAELPKRKYQKKEEPAAEPIREPEKKTWEEPKMEQPGIPELIMNILLEKMEELDAKLANIEKEKKQYESQYLEIAKFMGLGGAK